MTKSYDIQHDFFLASDEIANNQEFCFDEPLSKRDVSSSVHIKVSLLMGTDGEKIFKAIIKMGKSVLLIDDLPHFKNPIITSYQKLLIKGLASEFRKNGKKVYSLKTN